MRTNKANTKLRNYHHTLLKYTSKVMNKTKTAWQRHKNTITTILYIIILIFLIAIWETWGFIGFIIFIIGMYGLRLFRGRDKLILAFRYVETQLFGKPLERKYWEKGEMKKKKFKIVWKKKKQEDLKCKEKN